MTAKEHIELAPVEIARRFAEMGQVQDALDAYSVALRQEDTLPEDRMEAACAHLQFGEDYRVAYDAFLSLYREGKAKEDVLSILNDAFYFPNIDQQKKRYNKNCKLLKKYPYLFRRDFPAFDELSIKFYPYDDNGVLPFCVNEERFDEYIDFHEPVIRHYFFRDLSKPVLAENVFSQYELEYLRDNVRRSDWVGYENHIYLHYSNWDEFCSYLQCIDMKPILEEEKIVFLIGDEVEQYPIDFKERFGIDYSQYPRKPIGIREVNKIIWHTQLHAHSGGDFFNEILHEHPNIFAGESIYFSMIVSMSKNLQDTARRIAESKGKLLWGQEAVDRFGADILAEIGSLKDFTLKDAFVALNIAEPTFSKHISPGERIVPAIFFQPHFQHLNFQWELHDSGALALVSDAYQDIKQSGLLEGFKYIKTFTPLRRLTTSHAATIRFMAQPWNRNPDSNIPTFITDDMVNRLINRSFMVSDNDRIFADSRLVRFEDAKLNPKATFTALADFLDVPYTESMTYCSGIQGRDPYNIGFSTAAVYRTYDEYCDQYERVLIEYLLRDVYETYGYGYEHYDGKPMTQDQLEKLVEKAGCGLEWIRKSWWENRETMGRRYQLEGEKLDETIEELSSDAVARAKERRLLTVRILCHNLPFCNENGERLRFMKMLELDSALLENPVYR